MIQVCLNGRRGAGDSASVPLSPEAMAQSAAEAVAAGATDIHVHPRTPCGDDSLAPPVVAATLTAIRASVRVPVGVTTGAWTDRDPRRRVELIRGWTVLPDHASVNWHEPGAEEIAAALLERGVAVEAGLWSGTDAIRRFRRSPLASRVRRVLAEVTDTDAATATGAALLLLAELGEAHGGKVLLHGEDCGAWPVARLAVRLGLDLRIGLEDVLTLPDGRTAASNAELVSAAVALSRAPGAAHGAP